MERSLLEVEGYVSDFADDHPDVVVSRLRFSNVLGPDLDTPLSRALRLPVCPEIFGFDPRLQFTHQDDVLGALCFTARHDVPGIFNVAGDGTLPWSDVCRIVGRRRVPITPVGTGVAAGALRRLGIVDLPLELQSLLRFGRGVDNRRFKAAGYRYRYTSAGTVEDFARGLRLRSAVGDRPPGLPVRPRRGGLLPPFAGCGGPTGPAPQRHPGELTPHSGSTHESRSPGWQSRALAERRPAWRSERPWPVRSSAPTGSPP